MTRNADAVISATGTGSGRRVTENQIAFERTVRAQILDGADLFAPVEEVVEHSELASARRGVAHLDFDEPVAVRQRQRRMQLIAHHVVPSRAETNRDGERQAAGKGEALVADEHAHTELHVQPRDSHRVALMIKNFAR